MTANGGMDMGPPTQGQDPDISSVQALGAPPEDVGAETQARFRYQAEVAIRHCVEMLDDDRVVAVICEWFEDYLVVFADGRILMASVKSREGTRGPWRVRELANIGLRPLFRRWTAASEKPEECRLVTNGSLQPGPDEAASLKGACDRLDGGKLDEFAASLAEGIGGPIPVVRAFLGVLSIESDVPGRLDIGLNTIEHLLRPALRTLGLTELAAPRVYEAIVNLAIAAGRTTRAARVSTYGIVNEPAAIRHELEMDALLRQRTLTPVDVRAAAQSGALERPAALAPGRVAAASVMARKLGAGGFGPTQIASAQRLRAIWYETEARYRVGLPGSDDDFEDLRTRILAIAGDAETFAVSSTQRGESYGTAMHTDMTSRMDSFPTMTSAGVRLDSLHLQGLVYQMTDECLIWWSPPFDASPS